MLTNHEIEDICRFYRIPLNGCFLRDQTPRKWQMGFTVWNLDDSLKDDEELGTHWCCSLSDSQECVWFDSYGAPPPMEIDKHIKQQYKRYVMQNWIIQSLRSTNCGFYCIAVALYVQKYKRLYHSLHACVNSFVNLFNERTRESDGILRQFFASIKPVAPLVRQKLLQK